MTLTNDAVSNIKTLWRWIIIRNATKRNYGLLCFSIAITVFCLSCRGEKEIDHTLSSNNSAFPIYFGGKNVKNYTFSNGLTEGVSYEVRLPYPGSGAELLEFYDKKMKQMGFESYVEEYYAKGNREWHKFVDGTIKGEPEVAQLNASWADKKRTKRANLVLKYSWYIENKTPPYIIPPNDKLAVDFQIMPFVEFPPPQKVE